MRPGAGLREVAAIAMTIGATKIRLMFDGLARTSETNPEVSGNEAGGSADTASQKPGFT